MRFLRALVSLAVLAFLAAPLAGCASRQGSPESAYVVNAQGAVSPTSRSALAGSTAPGKQEILGLYLPFIGTGLAIKAGLEWDGTPTVIEVPVMNAPQSLAPQTIDVEETYMVPETRMVPKTRTVKRVVIPAPQAAPRACPMPPPAPASAAMPLPGGDDMACADGESCAVARK